MGQLKKLDFTKKKVKDAPLVEEMLNRARNPKLAKVVFYGIVDAFSKRPETTYEEDYEEAQLVFSALAFDEDGGLHI